MMVEQVRNALRAQPFRPFAIRLVDGTQYVVEHHDWVAIPPVDRPREITYYSVIEGDDYRTHWIAIGLILEIVVPADVAARGPKGSD
jgi:hypothetical protein